MYLLATDNSLACLRLSLLLCDSSYNELLTSLSPLYTEQISHEDRESAIRNSINVTEMIHFIVHSKQSYYFIINICKLYATWTFTAQRISQFEISTVYIFVLYL